MTFRFIRKVFFFIHSFNLLSEVVYCSSFLKIQVTDVSKFILHF